MKEELNDTWPDAGDDYKSPANHVNEAVIPLQNELDKSISIDFECQEVKPKLEFLSTTICKTENRSYSPIMEIEDRIEIDNLNKQKKLDNSVLIDFECQDVQPKLEFLSTTICKTENQSYSPIMEIEDRIEIDNLNKQKLIILIRKDFDYDNNCQFRVNSCLKLTKNTDVKKVRKTCQTKSSYKYETRRKTYKGKTNPT
ncbi:hypothetical protein TKK_0010777 [Trichogramma kaykai]